MQRAGFGGVEINSIAFPDRYKDTLGFAQVPWLSDRWLELVDFTMREAAARGMYSDLIVGSGWPFGAETLSRDEQIKMMALGTMEFEGPCKVTVRTDDLIRSATPKLLSANRDKLSELIEVRLFPAHITELIPGTPVTFAPGAQEVTIDVPAGRHIAYVVVKHTGYMGVIHGALGARGPVLDHFNAEAVRRYLNRMSDAMRPVVGNLHDRIRSFFTDSFELEGSNWCKDIREEFQKRRGYDLYTYYPLILKKVGPYGNEIKTPLRRPDRTRRDGAHLPYALRLRTDAGRALQGAFPRRTERMVPRLRRQVAHPGLRQGLYARRVAHGRRHSRMRDVVPQGERRDLPRRQDVGTRLQDGQQVRRFGRASLGQERRQLRRDHQHALRLQRDARTHQDHG